MSSRRRLFRKRALLPKERRRRVDDVVVTIDPFDELEPLEVELDEHDAEPT